MSLQSQTDQICKYRGCKNPVSATENRFYCKSHRDAAAARKRKSKHESNVEKCAEKVLSIMESFPNDHCTRRTVLGPLVNGLNGLGTSTHPHEISSDSEPDQPPTKKPKVIESLTNRIWIR
jgi:hypothetical protein